MSPNSKYSDRELNLALNSLEKREAALLSWGIVDGGFTFDEVLETLEKHFQCDREEAEEAMHALHERKLLLPFNDSKQDIWRTRAAETVRLAATLRQLFPSHFKHPGGWRQAPQLVADFRFAVRPRRYPARRYDAVAVEKIIGEKVRLSKLQTQALHVLVKNWKLSDFQVVASQRLLAEADGRVSRGLIVGAGTGSGKTLAFYLPAFLKTVESVATDQNPWVRVVALYPRNELLKDQLTKALGSVLELGAMMREKSRARPLTIGAYYGDAPYGCRGGQFRHYPDTSWRETSEGWICPYLRDPATGRNLVWRKTDVAATRERLHVEGGGALVADESSLRLSRDAMTKNPPDILFGSTEMLQRSMGSVTTARLFGMRTMHAPELVLLDEAHTYEGTTGAQVAYLLRRYRHALAGRGNPHFTGLSATLANPAPFFADLVGLPEHAITSVRADDKAYPQEEAGNEYLLALRGHPFSGAGLLSTTIQMIALMRRVLDPKTSDLGSSVSRGIVGQRLFVFTDDLDVTNRLFDDVANAEGLMPNRGRYIANPKREPLAALRSPISTEADDDERARFEDGQSWRLADAVGHPPELTQRIVVDRVSSQDTGVNFAADVVVATASLEVGFDDDRVGAVIQHKAPRSVAQFLQRKGRGGRPQEMRPWTVVTLSDYGRDRVAYQNYDALFDPEVPPQHLPLGNRYILRMQAASAMLDWLSANLDRVARQRHDFFDPYRSLTGPSTKPYVVSEQDSCAKVLRKLIEDPAGPPARDLQSHLSASLGISRDEALALAWEPPRALLTGAAPTLLRQLERHFEREGRDPEQRSPQPLPGFIPENLFSDLNLPEVSLLVPPIERGSFKKVISPFFMGVERSIREFAPGRVSRRFGHIDSDARHWIPVPTDGAEEVQIDLRENVGSGRRVEGDAIGKYTYTSDDGSIEVVSVLRPHQISVEQAPLPVSSSSNARTRWHTQIIPPSDEALTNCARHSVSKRLSWSSIVREVRFYTHLGHAPVEVRRFTTGSDARVLVSRGGERSDELRVRTTFASDGAPAALGFSSDVDAIAFVVTLPDPSSDSGSVADEFGRSLRSAYLHHLVVESPDLQHLNIFQRDWLYQALLGTTVIQARNGRTPNKLTGERAIEDSQRSLKEFLDRLLEVQIDPETGETARGKHGEDLSATLESHDVVRALQCAAVESWNPEPANHVAWQKVRCLVTLGAALLSACAEVLRTRSEDGLVLDLDGGPQQAEGDSPIKLHAGESLIWISEATPGGSGLVESVLQAYSGDPRAFFAGADQALQGSDLELVASEMPRAVRAVVEDDAVRAKADAARRAEGLAAATSAHGELRDALTRAGILCAHAVYSSLSHRLLRPGASGETAELLAALVTHWDALEESSGFEVDARVFAHIAAREDEFTAMIPAVPSSYLDDPIWRAGTYYGLLWSRGSELRSSALRPYSPYAEFPSTDRFLLLRSLPDRGDVAMVEADNWVSTVEDSLGRHGVAYLTSSAGAASKLSKALLMLAETPLEAGFLHVHPVVSGLTRTPDGFRARLVLPEALQ